jgi:predicted transcriptional regulator
MIKLIEKQKIIIAYFRKGKSQRQIAQDLHINRRTVAKYIKGYETKKAQLTDSKGNSNKEELIVDIVENPKYDTTKQQKKKIDIYEALKKEGFDIGYTTTCNTIRKINKESKEAYIRQEYAFHSQNS